VRYYKCEGEAEEGALAMQQSMLPLSTAPGEGMWTGGSVWMRVKAEREVGEEGRVAAVVAASANSGEAEPEGVVGGRGGGGGVVEGKGEGERGREEKREKGTGNLRRVSLTSPDEKKTNDDTQPKRSPSPFGMGEGEELSWESFLNKIGCIDTLNPKPNTQRPTPDTQHPTPNAQHPTPNTQHTRSYTLDTIQ
jgi:hypothetical protein